MYQKFNFCDHKIKIWAIWCFRLALNEGILDNISVFERKYINKPSKFFLKMWKTICMVMAHWKVLEGEWNLGEAISVIWQGYVSTIICGVHISFQIIDANSDLYDNEGHSKM